MYKEAATPKSTNPIVNQFLLDGYFSSNFLPTQAQAKIVPPI